MFAGRGTVISLYGNTALKRGYCTDCDSMAIIQDGKLKCCGKPFANDPTRVRREIEPEYRRRLPSRKDQRQILETQDYRCIYCDSAFGTIRNRKGKPVILRLCWDHSTPFAHTQNNHGSNFVAACHVCNSLKSDFIFRDLEDARLALQLQRQVKGFDF